MITIAGGAAQQLEVRFTGGDPRDRAWEALEALSSLAASGQLDLLIGRIYHLAEAASAHADFEPDAAQENSS